MRCFSSAVLICAVLLGYSTSSFAQDPATPVFSNPHSITINVGDPPVLIDPAVTVGGSYSYADGYVRFSVNGSVATDHLALSSAADPNANGAISLAGGFVYLGEGGSKRIIGAIDTVENGMNGQPLKILLAAPLNNASFETGDTTGWTVDTNFPGLPGDTHGSITQTFSVVDATDPFVGAIPDGDHALRLDINGGVTVGFGTAHGPVALSDQFEAQTGDTIAVSWMAKHISDHYDVYGFIVNDATGQEQQLFYSRGTDKPWGDTQIACPWTGDQLRFKFICGTYDATGGHAVGALLYVDRVRVISATTLGPGTVQQIARQVTYENTAANPASVRPITLALQNSVGLVLTADTSININHLPVISSLNGTPLPAYAGQDVDFTATATDVNGDALTYTWDFGDGGSAVGANATHAFPATGTYTVTVTVNDDYGGVTGTLSVLIVTAPSLAGVGPDSDGDGYSDSLEAFEGSDPMSPDSTPEGYAALGSPQLGFVKQLRIRLDLRPGMTGKDRIRLVADLPTPAGFSFAGQEVTVDIGGVQLRVTLNNQGIGRDGNVSVRCSRQRLGFTRIRVARGFVGDYKGTLAATSGLDNANVAGEVRMVRVSILFNNLPHVSNVYVSYKAQENRRGQAKSGRSAGLPNIESPTLE